MKQLFILLKLSLKFTKKYIFKYLLELIKPLVVAFVGVVLFSLCFINPILSFVSLLSVPCFCYAFWRGYVITYALIPCANSFIKNNSVVFKDCIFGIKKLEGRLALFVCFIAVFTIILYIPSFFYVFKLLPLNDFGTAILSLQEFSKQIDNAFFINTLLLSPFLNFALCAFYYRKQENYFNLFLNCYKKLNILGAFLALVITLFSYKCIVLYIILALFLNPFIYSINTFWYLSRPETLKNK